MTIKAHYLLLTALCASCASLGRAGGAAAGAAAGSVIGPGGAAAGAAIGSLTSEAAFPSESAPQPETVWGLLGKLVDQAAWLAFVMGLLWILTWIAPSPKDLFKRAIARWRSPEVPPS